MMDLHCHIDLYPEPLSIIEKAKDAGLYVLSVTTTPKAWEKTHALTSHIPRFQTSLGLHPQLAHLREHELDLFDLLFNMTDYIGEIGLDGSQEYRQYLPNQFRVFRHILKKCQDNPNKILTVHSRGASNEVLSELEKFGNVGNVILHWYSGTKRDLERALNLNCWFSVGPAMINSSKGKKIISWIPHDKILLETDGPFATNNGKALVPTDVYLLIEYLSSIWNKTEQEVLCVLKTNLFALTEIITENQSR